MAQSTKPITSHSRHSRRLGQSSSVTVEAEITCWHGRTMWQIAGINVQSPARLMSLDQGQHCACMLPEGAHGYTYQHPWTCFRGLVYLYPQQHTKNRVLMLLQWPLIEERQYDGVQMW